MTPEGKVKAKVNKALLPLKPFIWKFMAVQTGYGIPGLDYLLCVGGLFIAIETKKKGGVLTERQLDTKADIEAAGGVVFVVDDDASLNTAMLYIGGRVNAFKQRGANEDRTNQG